MTHPLLSQALKEAYASGNNSSQFVETIEIVYGATTLRYCTGLIQQTLNVPDPQIFYPVPFKLELPAQDSTGARTLTVTVENVDGEVIGFINAAKASGLPVSVKYRTFLIEQSLSPQNPRPIVFTLTGATMTLTGVKFTAAVADMVNRSFPNEFYSYSRFPGLR